MSDSIGDLIDCDTIHHKLGGERFEQMSDDEIVL